jgi:hypothetical protein
MMLPAFSTTKLTVFLEASHAVFPSSSSHFRVIVNLPRSFSVPVPSIRPLAFTSAVTLTSTDSPASTFTLENESVPFIVVPLSLTSAADLPLTYR